MKQDDRDPRRWKGGQDPPHQPERWLAEAFRSMPEPDDVDLQAGWRRLESSERSRPARRATGRRWAPALFGLVLPLFAATTFAAIYRVVHRQQRTAVATDHPRALIRSHRAASAQAPTVDVAPTVDAGLAVEVAPPLPELPRVPEADLPATKSIARDGRAGLDDEPRSRVPALRPAPDPVRPAPPADSPPPAPSEAHLLAQALRLLRTDGDAEAALRMLDQRASAFGHGLLSTEASRVRAEALLRLGREDEALPILDGLSDDAIAPTRGLSLVRGELRAAHQRCQQAEPDLTRVLQTQATDPLAERALYARATCRAQMGDHAGALTDRQAYLRTFHGGSHRQQMEDESRR